MRILCISEFLEQYKILSKKDRDLESDIIDYFFSEKTCEELKAGTNLNCSQTRPFIKKRINGSGGYRFYYMIILENGDVVLAFFHPKVGPKGEKNIPAKLKAELQKKINDIFNKGGDVFEIINNSGELVFTQIEQKKNIPAITK